MATTPPATPTATPSPTTTPTPTPTEIVFEVGNQLTIRYLRQLSIEPSPITFLRELEPGYNYERHLVSYQSQGHRIYGLLTIPYGEAPPGGHKAIVFNHGYIPPRQYSTTSRYESQIHFLARTGFVVFKIDYRGHGRSEGEAEGSYFSPGYTIDALTAFKSLQELAFINPQAIGMWGHSMGGNVVLRAMLIEPEIRAGVIWAGAVYSYDDFARYGISDRTYQPPPTAVAVKDRHPSLAIRELYGTPDTRLPYWRAVSLTENIETLVSPLQLHHARDDRVVDIGYAQELAAVLEEKGKEYEFYAYEKGGHNLISPSFRPAMLATVEFFNRHLGAE